FLEGIGDHERRRAIGGPAVIIGIADIGPAAVAIAKPFAGVYGVFIGFCQIIMPDALGIGVGEHHHRGIADHTTGIGIHELPAFEVLFAAPVRQIDEGADHVIDDAGVDDRLQWHLAAVDVPAAKHGAFCIVGTFVGVTVGAGIGTVDIGEDARVEQRVIERGIEHGSFLRGAAIDAHLVERLRPPGPRLPVYEIEVPAGNLGVQVIPRPFDAHERDAGLHRDLFAGVGIKLGEETEMFALLFADVSGDGRGGYALLILLVFYVLAFAGPANART